MNSKKLVRDTIKRNNSYDRIPYSFGVPPGFENNSSKKLVMESTYGCIINCLPVIVIFIVFQKSFVEGLTRGSVKE